LHPYFCNFTFELPSWLNDPLQEKLAKDRHKYTGKDARE